MTSPDQNVRELAAEFGASEDIMAQFVARFAPGRVAPNAYAAPSDTMLFVHIPKTAGVSIGKSFQSTFDKFHAVQWDSIGPSFRHSTRQAAYNQSRGAGRQVIMGHFGWPEIQLWRNHEMAIKCGAIFRHPVERLVSNFNYNRSSAHPGRVGFTERFPTVESYARNAELDVQLTQALGFVSSFDEALAKLNRYYTFLGITEKLSASLAHLARSHGLRPFQEHRANVGSNKEAVVSAELSRMILDRSHNDLKLHRLLTRLYA
ncbi:MAG: sulfotransferase family 2 domain-containing protein [Paracoccus sp. (in: a-proteobacteria)]|uniref:hypothetical protein n=1 Tax=Paracoccus sp. TaxID=267 RepID=UPI0039E2F99D